MVETLPSYLKDSSDILRKLNDIQLEENMYIFTCDVESLYTSIRHTDGLEAVRFFLVIAGLDLEFGEFVLRLLKFALTHNFFLF